MRTMRSKHDHQVPLQLPPALRRLVVKEGGKLVDGEGTLVGASISITDPKSQSRALSLVGSVDWIQVRVRLLLCGCYLANPYPETSFSTSFKYYGGA